MILPVLDPKRNDDRESDEHKKAMFLTGKAIVFRQEWGRKDQVFEKRILIGEQIPNSGQIIKFLKERTQMNSNPYTGAHKVQNSYITHWLDNELFCAFEYFKIFLGLMFFLN